LSVLKNWRGRALIRFVSKVSAPNPDVFNIIFACLATKGLLSSAQVEHPQLLPELERCVLVAVVQAKVTLLTGVFEMAPGLAFLVIEGTDSMVQSWALGLLKVITKDPKFASLDPFILDKARQVVELLRFKLAETALRDPEQDRQDEGFLSHVKDEEDAENPVIIEEPEDSQPVGPGRRSQTMSILKVLLIILQDVSYRALPLVLNSLPRDPGASLSQQQPKNNAAPPPPVKLKRARENMPLEVAVVLVLERCRSWFVISLLLQTLDVLLRQFGNGCWSPSHSDQNSVTPHRLLDALWAATTRSRPYGLGPANPAYPRVEISSLFAWIPPFFKSLTNTKYYSRLRTYRNVLIEWMAAIGDDDAFGIQATQNALLIMADLFQAGPPLSASFLSQYAEGLMDAASTQGDSAAATVIACALARDRDFIRAALFTPDGISAAGSGPAVAGDGPGSVLRAQRIKFKLASNAVFGLIKSTLQSYESSRASSSRAAPIPADWSMIFILREFLDMNATVAMLAIDSIGLVDDTGVQQSQADFVAVASTMGQYNASEIEQALKGYCSQFNDALITILEFLIKPFSSKILQELLGCGSAAKVNYSLSLLLAQSPVVRQAAERAICRCSPDRVDAETAFTQLIGWASSPDTRNLMLRSCSNTFKEMLLVKGAIPAFGRGLVLAEQVMQTAFARSQLFSPAQPAASASPDLTPDLVSFWLNTWDLLLGALSAPFTCKLSGSDDSQTSSKWLPANAPFWAISSLVRTAVSVASKLLDLVCDRRNAVDSIRRRIVRDGSRMAGLFASMTAHLLKQNLSRNVEYVDIVTRCIIAVTSRGGRMDPVSVEQCRAIIEAMHESADPRKEQIEEALQASAEKESITDFDSALNVSVVIVNDDMEDSFDPIEIDDSAVFNEDTLRSLEDEYFSQEAAKTSNSSPVVQFSAPIPASSPRKLSSASTHQFGSSETGSKSASAHVRGYPEGSSSAQEARPRKRHAGSLFESSIGDTGEVYHAQGVGSRIHVPSNPIPSTSSSASSGHTSSHNTGKPRLPLTGVGLGSQHSLKSSSSGSLNGIGGGKSGATPALQNALKTFGAQASSAPSSKIAALRNETKADSEKRKAMSSRMRLEKVMKAGSREYVSDESEAEETGGGVASTLKHMSSDYDKLYSGPGLRPAFRPSVIAPPRPGGADFPLEIKNPRPIQILEIPGNGKTAMQMQAQHDRIEKAKRTKRFNPDVSSVYKIILSWDVNKLDQTKIEGLMPIPQRFDAVETYLTVFQPLLLLECLGQLEQARDEISPSDFMKIEPRGLSFVDSFLDITIAMPSRTMGDAGGDRKHGNGARSGLYFSENDLIVIRIEKNQPGASTGAISTGDEKEFLAIVQKIQHKSGEIVLRAAHASISLSDGTSWRACKLANLITFRREFQALAGFPHSDLRDWILDPSASPHLGSSMVDASDVSLFQSSFGLNQPQARAVSAVIRQKAGFTLIQGWFLFRNCPWSLRLSDLIFSYLIFYVLRF
jgi:hypothetical protein